MINGVYPLCVLILVHRCAQSHFPSGLDVQSQLETKLESKPHSTYLLSSFSEIPESKVEVSTQAVSSDPHAARVVLGPSQARGNYNNRQF